MILKEKIIENIEEMRRKKEEEVLIAAVELLL